MMAQADCEGDRGCAAAPLPAMPESEGFYHQRALSVKQREERQLPAFSCSWLSCLLLPHSESSRKKVGLIPFAGS